MNESQSVGDRWSKHAPTIGWSATILALIFGAMFWVIDSRVVAQISTAVAPELNGITERVTKNEGKINDIKEDIGEMKHGIREIRSSAASLNEKYHSMHQVLMGIRQSVNEIHKSRVARESIPSAEMQSLPTSDPQYGSGIWVPGVGSILGAPPQPNNNNKGLEFYKPPGSTISNKSAD